MNENFGGKFGGKSLEFYQVSIIAQLGPLIKNAVNTAVYFEGILAKNIFSGVSGCKPKGDFTTNLSSLEFSNTLEKRFSKSLSAVSVIFC